MQPIQINDSKAKSFGTMTVISAWLAVFCLFGYRSCFSIMQQSMIADLGWSTLQTSGGYCVMMTIYAITAFFSGSMIDKKGPRSSYAIGAVCCFLGFFLTSIAPLSKPSGFFLYLFTYGLFAGVGTGMLWVSSTVSCRKWYVGAKYGTAWGLAFMGAPMAQMLLTLVLKPILQNMGWQVGMKVMSFIMAVLLIIASLIARRLPEHYCDENGNPRTAFGDAVKKDAPSRTWGVGEAFKSYPIWGTIFAFMGSVMAEFLVWSQIVSYFQTDMGLSLNTASNIYIVIGIAGIFAMPITGRFSDGLVKKLGNERKARRIMLLIAPACGIIGVVLCLTKSVALCCIAMVILAIYWGIEPGGCAGYAGTVYGGKTYGRIWGLATLITMGIGPSCGTFFGAFFKDHFGTFKVSLIFALCAYIVSFLFAFSLPNKCKWEK